ncbi:MAG: hypothetical protein HYV52_03525 [Parcubacteria group bacterium]|nr:hypothetical protein [Parcubacteria group bacterium]
MANICPTCKKSSTMVTHRQLLRGKYNPTSRKRKYPNLQWVALPSALTIGKKTIKRIKTCSNCRKTIAQGKMSLEKIKKSLKN